MNFFTATQLSTLKGRCYPTTPFFLMALSSSLKGLCPLFMFENVNSSAFCAASIFRAFDHGYQF